MKIRNPQMIFLSACIFAAAIRALFWTLRREFRTDVANTNPYEDLGAERYLYCVWHDSVVMPTFGGKHRHSAALTSLHKDGSFVAYVLKACGIDIIRGSNHQGGAAAVRQLLTAAERKHLVVTPDGPRGPQRTMSKGIVFLASRTGRAIIPTAYACHRCWTIPGSWTTLTIPKPFSKVIFLAGAPIHVPPDLSIQQLDPYVTRVQSEMDSLHARLDRGPIHRRAA